MKTLTTFILAGALALLAQPNQLDLRQDPPTAVQSERVSSAYTGTSGATTYYYWVVTRYPIGFIVPTSPVIVGGASALGGGNSVALAWPAMTGASSYDVLRTTTNAAPSSCTCAVVLATTGTTLTDNGAALSAWPPGGLNSAGVAQAELQINNRDAGAPYITMAVRNAQRTLNYQLGILKNGTAPGYVPSGFIQPYSNAQGALSCVDSAGADCMATRPGPTNYCADVGAVNAYACSLSPAITAYSVGNSYRFKAATTNTGPPTVNFNALGAVAIKTAAGADPATGDIRAGQMVDVVYAAGSVMQMQSAGIGTVRTPLQYGCSGNGTTDDRTCMQAMLTETDSAGGGVVEIPAGYTFRVTDYLQARGNNLTIRGGGKIFCDPAVNAGGHPAFTPVGSIYPSCLVLGKTTSTLGVQSDPNDIMTGITGGQDSNLLLENFTIYGNSGYVDVAWNGQPEPDTNIPLANTAISIWAVDKVVVSNLKIHSFGTDGIEPWGVSNLAIADNVITNIGFNAIGTWETSDVSITGNVITSVGQGIEATSLRYVISGNKITKVSMSGITAGGQGSNLSNSYVSITGNVLQADSTSSGYPIYLGCNVGLATCIKQQSITGNVASGWAEPLISSVPVWQKYSILAIANGVNGCAAATGCWQINGTLGAALRTDSNVQNVTVASVAILQMFNWGWFKTTTACTGSGLSAITTGLGVAGNGTLFLPNTAYDLTAAAGNYNNSTLPFVGVGNVTATLSESLVFQINTTGGNVNVIDPGCAFDIHVLSSLAN